MVLNLPGLMGLGLIMGEGISCFKLSTLGTRWTSQTWISFYCFYAIFVMVYLLFDSISPSGLLSALRVSGKSKQDCINKTCTDSSQFAIEKKQTTKKCISVSSGDFSAICTMGLLALSALSFLIEAVCLGYIPLFTENMPHAYSYFHLPGLHYFTTLAVLTPSVAWIYMHQKKSLDMISFIGLFFPFVLTVLMVSRFQFVFSLFLLFFTSIICGIRYRFWQILLMVFVLLSVYIFITIERAHSVSYLNEIFAMKDPNTPIFITQPYMYIANNYDNFNVMTQKLIYHSCGYKMLYPFVTLSGLKFFFPIPVDFPLYTTKEELTTITLLYDAWYDFGLKGIVLLAVILGFVSNYLQRIVKQARNPFGKLIYSQFCFYFLFSFFTTWFSNPATWFYLFWSLLFYLLYQHFVR